MHLNRGFSPALWMPGIVSAWSQTVHPPDTAIDVASIKPARPEARGYSIRPFPGRLSAENVTLKLLIAEAYHVYDFQISGPKWIDSERYDLEAKIGGDAPPSKQSRASSSLLTRSGSSGATTSEKGRADVETATVKATSDFLQGAATSE